MIIGRRVAKQGREGVVLQCALNPPTFDQHGLVNAADYLLLVEMHDGTLQTWPADEVRMLDPAIIDHVTPHG